MTKEDQEDETLSIESGGEIYVIINSWDLCGLFSQGACSPFSILIRPDSGFGAFGLSDPILHAENMTSLEIQKRQIQRGGR